MKAHVSRGLEGHSANPVPQGNFFSRLSTQKARGSFFRQVEEISGQNPLACNQCGKCGAGCPAAMGMDLLPHQVIRLVQLGMEEVVESEAIWTCAACLTCVARCPKGVDLPRIMEALRTIYLERNGNRAEAGTLSGEAMGELPPMAVIGSWRKLSR